MKNIILAWCLFYSSLTMAFPPVGAIGQSGTSTLYPILNKAPYNQITNLGSGAALIETGSENMLVNPGFEALDNGSTPTGWTCTTGTCTTEKTIFTSGKQSMKVVPAANVFDISQQISTPANIQKQGVMGIAYNIPATCTTAQVEISVDGAVQTTVPVTSLILDGAFHSIEVPTTFGSTSAKLRAYSTATCTGNIYFDAAYIKQGIGFQNLQLDNVYSATVSAAGVVSNQNKSWITGNASIAGTSAYTITFNTGLFTVTPNCSVTIEQNNTNIALISAATNSSITVITYLASTAGTQSASNFTIICQKQGNDYLSSSSAVYSQASAAPALFVGNKTSTQAVTANVTNITFSSLKDNVNGWVTDTYTVKQAGDYLINVEAFDNAGSASAIAIYKNGAQYSLLFQSAARANGSVTLPNLVVGDTITFRSINTVTLGAEGNLSIVRLPQTGLIVGSFAGYTNVPGYQGNVDTFSVSYGANGTACSSSPCTITQKGTAVSQITWSSAGVMGLVTAKTYSTLFCTGNAQGTSFLSMGGWIGSALSPMSCSNCNGFQFITGTATTATNSAGTLNCQGTY